MPTSTQRFRKAGTGWLHVRGHALSLLLLILALNSCQRPRPEGDATIATSGTASSPRAALLKDTNGRTRPFPTAQKALDAAQPGETVILAPGVHRGSLHFKTSGVVLKGEPGAIVNGNAPDWRPSWRQEPAYGPRAYSSPVPFAPGVVTVDDRVMIDVRANRAGKALPLIHRDGFGRSGRTPVQSLFTYLDEQKRVLVSFADDRHPDQRRIELCPQNSAAITVCGHDNCSVEGLIVTGGNAGVKFEKTVGSVVRKCLIYAVDENVELAREAENCKVLSCDLTMNPDAVSFNTDPETGVPGGDVWNAHKRFGTSDKTAVFLHTTGSNHEIAYNFIYDVWNGVMNDYGVSPGDVRAFYENHAFPNKPRYNIGMSVHHNWIDLTLDDALEPNGEAAHNRWYANYVTRAHCAVRFKTIAIGPFYFYDNVMLNNHDGLRLYKSSPKQSEVFIYHNVIQHKDGVIYHGTDSVCWNDPWLEQNLERGTPGFHIYNNVFLSEVPFSNRSRIQPNYKADVNMFTCPADPKLGPLGIDPNGLFDQTPCFTAPSRRDWRLKPGTPGTEAGQDLSTFPHKLPHCESGYFGGRRPDVGALGIDQDKTPRGPVSGLWEIAARTIDIGEKDVSSFVPEPVRWVKAKPATFVLDGFGDRDQITVNVIRSGGKPDFVITATDENGKVLAQTREDEACAFAETALTIPVSGKQRVILTGTCQGKPALWRVEAPEGVRVGLKATDFVYLTKHDGGPYDFEYPIGPGIDSFTIRTKPHHSGACKVTVIAPHGNRVNPDASGTVATDGHAGTYRVRYTFTKKAEIAIEGPSPVLYISRQQAGAAPRPLWAKEPWE